MWRGCLMMSDKETEQVVDLLLSNGDLTPESIEEMLLDLEMQVNIIRQAFSGYVKEQKK